MIYNSTMLYRVQFHLKKKFELIIDPFRLLITLKNISSSFMDQTIDIQKYHQATFHNKILPSSKAETNSDRLFLTFPENKSSLICLSSCHHNILVDTNYFSLWVRIFFFRCSKI